MADPNLQYNPSDGWNNSSTFPTNPNKTQVRGLMQLLFDQVRDFINNSLISWIKATYATKADVSGIALGNIPDGSVTIAKLAFDPATQTELDAQITIQNRIDLNQNRIFSMGGMS